MQLTAFNDEHDMYMFSYVLIRIRRNICIYQKENIGAPEFMNKHTLKRKILSNLRAYVNRDFERRIEKRKKHHHVQVIFLLE